MGFLESAGRSGAIGRFGDTMFQNALAVSENQRQNEAMAMQAQEMATKQKLIDAKLAEEERKNRPKLLSELVGAGTEKGKPNFMKLWSEAAKIYGKKITLPDGKEDYTVTENDIPNIQKHLETQKDLHPQVMWAQYQDNLLSLQTREKERAKIKTAPELQAFDEETERMKVENAGILTEFGRGAEEKASASKRSLVKVMGPGGNPVFMSQDDAEGQEAWTPPSAPAERKVSVNALTPEENEALTRAIDDKRLNPNKVNSRTAKIYAQMEMNTPGMSFAGQAADIEANTGSLKNQQKIRDMMASFVLNMNAQIKRMSTIIHDVTRLDTRLANVPIRNWAMTVKGSAAESIVSMYLTEISNEIGKLSTGSAASVAELSEGAQKKWDKIHDPNLSAKDLLRLLEETRHAGNLRIKSVDNVIASTRKELKGKTPGPAPIGGGGSDPLGLGL